MKFLIVTGGNIDQDIALTMLGQSKGFFIIAVDKGLETVYAHRIIPDLIMGDFDSVTEGILQYFREKDVTIVDFPIRKDATDTQLALEEAIERGAAEITIIGATGSRLDHTISNINILGIAAKHHIPCSIIDSYNEISLLVETTEVYESENKKYISFLPYTEDVEGLTLQGFEYPLLNYHLKKDTSIAISNVLQDRAGRVSFTKGILIMLRTRD